ncbi:MAG: DNA/RNA non-specific endonuclease [Coriobacteriales bacterium]|nr:DNA/RNA non-specific endonuclease [Coriobacteriales bacterium]
MRRTSQGNRPRHHGFAPLLLLVFVGALAGLVLGGGQSLWPLLENGAAPFWEEADGYGSPTPSVWNEATAPEYYQVVGSALYVTDLGPGKARYSSFDSLGRTRRAEARVTYEMMEAGRAREREDVSEIKPSGWGHNCEADVQQADGSWYHGYFWNRSHLIAKALGGTDGADNLICGTRMQNVGSNSQGKGAGGMSYGETLVRSWLEEHRSGSVSYVVTPAYVENELVCRSVFVDILSSDGALDLRIEVFNAAKGYVIDYTTGTFTPAV